VRTRLLRSSAAISLLHACCADAVLLHLYPCCCHHCAADPGLFAEWKAELAGMAGRIKDMRAALQAALRKRNVPGDW
jgi:hypothetical protein